MHITKKYYFFVLAMLCIAGIFVLFWSQRQTEEKKSQIIPEKQTTGEQITANDQDDKDAVVTDTVSSTPKKVSVKHGEESKKVDSDTDIKRDEGLVAPVLAPQENKSQQPPFAEPSVLGPVSDVPQPTPRLASDAEIRALWVWNDVSTIVSSKSAQDTFFAFLAAPHGDSSAKLNRIFLSGDSLDLAKNTTAVKAFLARAHDRGIAVEYLTGKSRWVRTSDMHEAVERCERVAAYNSSVSAAERFDGIHYDNEPYTLAEWKTNTGNGEDKYNDELETNYVRILTTCRATLNAANQLTTTIGVDVPTWFHSSAVDIWKPLTAAASPVSMITIMNYFDTEEEFLYGYGGTNKSGGIGPNIRAANGIPIIAGAETKADIESTVSFAAAGRDYLHAMFSKAFSVFGEEKNFAGVAVHHYRTYRDMK